MNIVRAREIIHSLAEGIDPTTGEVFPEESTYNQPDVIRALYTILEATAPKQPDPFRNAGKPWTTEEEALLQNQFAEKMKIADIAKAHGRTYGAIESRLEHLGLKKKPFWLFKRK